MGLGQITSALFVFSVIDSSPIFGIARDKSSKWLMNHEFWEVWAEMTIQFPTGLDLPITLLQ
jgi:hypothetical protein